METFFDIKFRLWNDYKTDPQWLESLPYWEFQLWVDKLNEHIEKKNQELTSENGKVQVFSLSNPSSR